LERVPHSTVESGHRFAQHLLYNLQPCLDAGHPEFTLCSTVVILFLFSNNCSSMIN
jgi:hypothetical protein